MAADKDFTEPYALPPASAIGAANALTLLDHDSRAVSFKSLTLEPPEHRHLVIFIRHFFCGMCEAYVRTLGNELPPSLLATTSPPTVLSIVSCGSTANIPDYQNRTGCPFPIYCDPERKVYQALGMVQNLAIGTKQPTYQNGGVTGTTVKSLGTLVASGWKGWTGGGDFKQNGGEWLFSETGELRWCHRMTNTRDHAEVDELKEVLGIKE